MYRKTGLIKSNPTEQFTIQNLDFGLLGPAVSCKAARTMGPRLLELELSNSESSA
jgi:hypothetical protein